MSVSVVITLALSLVPLLAAFSSLHAVSPQDKFEELIREEGGLATDTSKEEGKYVLAVAAVYLASGTDMSRTLETARMMAQRDLAAFLDGSSVSVEEESRTEISGKEIKDFFSSVVQTEVKHVLRMANVLDTRVKDDEKSLAEGYRQSEFEHDCHEISGEQQEISTMQNAQANSTSVFVLNASVVIRELLGKHQDEEIYAQCEIV